MSQGFYVKVLTKLNSDYKWILLNEVNEKQIINRYSMAHRPVLTNEGFSYIASNSSNVLLKEITSTLQFYF